MTDASVGLPEPTGLRLHLRAEDIRIPRRLRARSRLLIARAAAQPFAFIGVALVVARLSDSRATVIPVAAVFFLLAHRSFQTLVHDLSHRLFSSSNAARNDILGNWLAAGWIGSNVAAYRAVHFEHHRKNGSSDDPEFIDMALIRARGGLFRHMLRYVLLLEVVRLVRKYYGSSTESGDADASASSPGLVARLAMNAHVLVTQAFMFGLCWFVADAPYLFAVWAYLLASWSPMLSSLRFLVEHPGATDLTVTTPSWLVERAFFAPFGFNFHFEHHAWPSIPPYRLKAVHRHLAQAEFFDRHPEYLGSTYLAGLRARAAE